MMKLMKAKQKRLFKSVMVPCRGNKTPTQSLVQTSRLKMPHTPSSCGKVYYLHTCISGESKIQRASKGDWPGFSL